MVKRLGSDYDPTKGFRTTWLIFKCLRPLNNSLLWIKTSEAWISQNRANVSTLGTVSLVYVLPECFKYYHYNFTLLRLRLLYFVMFCPIVPCIGTKVWIAAEIIEHPYHEIFCYKDTTDIQVRDCCSFPVSKTRMMLASIYWTLIH